MAPGGFTDVAMEKNPKGEFYGITLPKQKGGHEVLVSSSQLRGCRSIDVTMLRELAAGKEIPKSHPEYLSFLVEKPYKFHSFHLIFCDGIVLRSKLPLFKGKVCSIYLPEIAHERPIHRHDRETERMRLVTAQLTLAMSRIVHGGTIILLQHKLDSWTPARIVYSLSKFADICVFKPEKSMHHVRLSIRLLATSTHCLLILRPFSSVVRMTGMRLHSAGKTELDNMLMGRMNLYVCVKVTCEISLLSQYSRKFWT